VVTSAPATTTGTALSASWRATVTPTRRTTSAAATVWVAARSRTARATPPTRRSARRPSSCCRWLPVVLLLMMWLCATLDAHQHHHPAHGLADLGLVPSRLVLSRQGPALPPPSSPSSSSASDPIVLRVANSATSSAASKDNKWEVTMCNPVCETGVYPGKPNMPWQWNRSEKPALVLTPV